MKRIIAVVGARPQFIKHFPFEKACEGKIDLKTIHTGQHYDENMSRVFFDQLGMRRPDFILSLKEGNHGVKTAQMMIEIEQILESEKPDGIVVYGDTNSTLAGALVASKLHIPIFHIEAGLRSFNKQMPEEINRVLTDHISSCFFVPSSIAIENLSKEGIVNNVFEVGDIMKDVILYVQKNNLIQKENDDDYYYVTVHRPYNTDKKERLEYVLNTLNSLGKKVVMAIHPRTKNRMETFELKFKSYENINFIDPQPYLENLSLLLNSKGLITDSGGMQKEAYWLKKNCVTVRKETEWIETLEGGNNSLMFESLESLNTEIKKEKVNWRDDLYGDGEAAELMVKEMVKYFEEITEC